MSEVFVQKTMVYFEENQLFLLKRTAKETDKSLAQLLRDIVYAYFADQNKGQAKDPLFQMVGLGRAKEENNDSVEHDALLYGKDT